MDSDIPKAQVDPRRVAARRALTLVNLLIVWTATAWVVPHPSERFYLAVLPAYAGGAFWLWVFGERRAALRRGLISLVLAAGLLGVHVYELKRAPSSLIRGESTVWAYGIVAVILIARWIYIVLVGAISRVIPMNPSTRTGRRLALRVLILGLYSLIINGFLLAVMQTHFPKRQPPHTPRTLRLEFETVRFAAADGTSLAGWFVPSSQSERTAVVCHGVMAFKADMLDFIHALVDGGYNVLAFDFRGHGESGGRTVSFGAHEKSDVVAAIDWLRENQPQRCRRIVGVGWSMGAATLILAAAEDRRLEALFLDAPYARTYDIARQIASPFPPVYEDVGLVVGLAVASLDARTNLFTLAALDVIAQIAPRPILIVHGEDDRVIPISQGRLLFAAAGEPKGFVAIADAGHCQTLDVDTPHYQRRMLTFLDEALVEEP